MIPPPVAPLLSAQASSQSPSAVAAWASSKDTNELAALAQSVPAVVYQATAGAVLAGVFVITFLTSPILLLVLVACAVAALLTAHVTAWVVRQDNGPPQMREVVEAIREGTRGFLNTLFGVLSRLALLVAAAVGLLHLVCRVNPEQEAVGLYGSVLAAVTMTWFLMGVLVSSAACFCATWVVGQANARVANAASESTSARDAFLVAVRSGGVAAVAVVGMAVVGVTVLLALLLLVSNAGASGHIKPTEVPMLLVGFCFGGSFVALFAQLGGGIFSSAAAMSADMCSKTEGGGSDRSLHSYTAIANMVGGSVGGCMAVGADVFESVAAQTITTMVLGGALARRCRLENQMGFMLFPLVVHSLDLLVSSSSLLNLGGPSHSFVQRLSSPLFPSSGAQPLPSRRERGKGGSPSIAHSNRPLQTYSSSYQHPMDFLMQSHNLSSMLMGLIFVVVSRCLLFTEQAPYAWLLFAACGAVGIGAMSLLLLLTRVYTDATFTPVRRLSLSFAVGHGSNVVAGLALGLEATAGPALIICGVLLVSYWLGQASGLVDDAGQATGGTFGSAAAAAGMMCTSAHACMIGILGPIVDCAAGTAHMSKQTRESNQVCESLTAAGATAKAYWSGFASAAAAVTSFLLLRVFVSEASALSGIPFREVDMAVPEVFVSGMLGAVVVFLFSSYACGSVCQVAQEVTREVRAELRDLPPTLAYDRKYDHAECVAAALEASLRAMVKPALLAVAAPTLIGLFFRHVASMQGSPLLGAKAVAAFAMVAMVTGTLLAFFLNTAGAAWDSARRFIQTGSLGGKGSESHAAAVTADSVGSIFKGTGGPSLHVLVKLILTLGLVIAPILID